MSDLSQGVRWSRVNDEPFEYAIQVGPHGSEFVKLLNGECLRRPAEEIEDGARVPKVRTSHHRNKEEAARLQELVTKRYADDEIERLKVRNGQLQDQLQFKDEEIGEIRNQLVNAHNVLEAYEKWEADMILTNACWTGQNVQLTDELYERMIKIQGMRNTALGRFAQGDDAPSASMMGLTLSDEKETPAVIVHKGRAKALRYED